MRSLPVRVVSAPFRAVVSVVLAGCTCRWVVAGAAVRWEAEAGRGWASVGRSGGHCGWGVLAACSVGLAGVVFDPVAVGQASGGVELQGNIYTG